MHEENNVMRQQARLFPDNIDIKVRVFSIQINTGDTLHLICGRCQRTVYFKTTQPGLGEKNMDIFSYGPVYLHAQGCLLLPP